MQGVQVAPAFNDENVTRGPLLHSAFKENASSFQASGKQSSALKTARKAFGNITNTRSDAISQQPGTAKRRAFGDITNSAIKQPTGASTKKADSRSVNKPRSGNHNAASQVDPSSLAISSTAVGVAPPEAKPWWETAEPERPAGKTWEMLEADREREEDADIEHNVKGILKALRANVASLLQVQAAGDTDEEDLMPGPPPPIPDSIRLPLQSRAPADEGPSDLEGRLDSFEAIGRLFRSTTCGSVADIVPEVDVDLPDTFMQGTTTAISMLEQQQAAGAASSPHTDIASEVMISTVTSSHSHAHVEAIEETLTQLTLSNEHHGQLCSSSTITNAHICSSPEPSVNLTNNAMAHIKSPETMPW